MSISIYNKYSRSFNIIFEIYVDLHTITIIVRDNNSILEEYSNAYFDFSTNINNWTNERTKFYKSIYDSLMYTTYICKRQKNNNIISLNYPRKITINNKNIKFFDKIMKRINNSSKNKYPTDLIGLIFMYYS